MIEEESFLQKAKEKVTQIIGHGKEVKKLVELDMKGRELLATKDELKDNLTSFQGALEKSEEDMIKLGNEEMFTQYKALREATASMLDSAIKIDNTMATASKFMEFEILWLQHFQKFEVFADKFYNFALKFDKRTIFTPELRKRVKIRTTQAAVALGILSKINADISKDFCPIDTYIVTTEKQRKYQKEYEERRKKFLNGTNKTSQ